MNKIVELLPLLIPVVIGQFALLAAALFHIFTHNSYKRGSRTLWLVITLVFMNYVGPILYFVLGREDS